MHAVVVESVPALKAVRCPFTDGFPKRFHKHFQKEYAIVNLDKLNKFDEDTKVTPELLIEKGIIKNTKDGVKILGNGQLNVKLHVVANAFSETAKAKIEAAGGKTEVI